MSLHSRVVNRLCDLYRRVIRRQRVADAIDGGPVGAMRRLHWFAMEPLEQRVLMSSVSVTTGPGTVVFDVTDGLAHTIVLSDDPTPGNGSSMLTVDGTETHVFANPATSLTLNAAPGAVGDTITLDALDSAFSASIQINSNGGDDQITLDATTGPGAVTAHGGAVNDTFNVKVSSTSSITIDGGADGTAAGDSVTIDALTAAITADTT
ncbi:MAG: LEPR-XLL domain-containing protein, partial [Planctomycetota bacterium]|nr:LEPR-XLL domain-containing protein [Planctomycetota bacterium]